MMQFKLFFVDKRRRSFLKKFALFFSASHAGVLRKALGFFSTLFVAVKAKSQGMPFSFWKSNNTALAVIRINQVVAKVAVDSNSNETEMRSSQVVAKVAIVGGTTSIRMNQIVAKVAVDGNTNEPEIRSSQVVAKVAIAGALAPIRINQVIAKVAVVD